MSERAAKPAGLSDVARGAAFMVGAAFLFAAMGVMVQLSSRTLPNAMVVFLRSGLSLVLLTPWFLGRSGIGLRSQHLKEHLLRGVFGIGSMYCFFYAITHLRLADALLLNYSLPLFVPLVERAWLGEPVPKGLWRALLLGSCGLLLILKPGLTILRPAAIVGIVSAVLSATAQVGVRGLTRTEPVMRIVYYFCLVSTFVSLFPALGAWVSPSAAAWPALLALGVTATVAQLLMTRAYACAPAARVGPFIYTAVVFGALFDALIFARLPDALSVAGGVFVVAAGVAVLRLRSSATKRVEA